MAKARVLAVDDQLYFRVFLEDLLAQEGYEVQTAASGDEALRLLEGERFDVLLVDLVMPGMGGKDLVKAVKERGLDPEIVVVTSVSDVKVAVDAMKLGATDYLLKPIDRADLTRSLDTLLQRRRLRDEHARLMEENLEFLGVLSLYERTRALYQTLALEPLADRIIEGLCLETRSQSGVLWIAPDEGGTTLRLQGARGLVRLETEAPELAREALPEAVRGLTSGEVRSAVVASEGDRPPALWVALRDGAALLGVARLTDRLEGRSFGDPERASAQRFAEFAEVAAKNALRFRTLERRSFRDPTTQAYTDAYLEDAVRNEIHKANRFGRSFSLVRFEFEGIDALRDHLGASRFGRWIEGVAHQLSRSLRSTDLLAIGEQRRFTFFLPETESLGAVILKRRVATLLEQSEPMESLVEKARPAVLSACTSFPVDGTQLDTLTKVLDQRLAQDRESLVRRLSLTGRSFSGLVESLLERAEPAPEGVGEQVTRFVLEEVSRRPGERGLVFCAPGDSLIGSVREGLEGLRGVPVRGQIVVMTERLAQDLPGLPVTWVPPARAGTRSPFLIYLGDGPAYAWMQAGEGNGSGPEIFHTEDRSLIEHLAFQLGRDLGIPLGQQ